MRGLTLAVLLLLPAAAFAQPAEKPVPDLSPQKVLVLGKTQLLSGADGYPAFCSENAGRKRTELRRVTVATLKKIAATEQPGLLKALGEPKDAKSLWIVNAVLVELTPDRIEEVRKLETVLAVFPAGAVPETGPAGKVSEVLKPARRKPFSAKGREIPWNLKLLHVPAVWTKLKTTGRGAVVAMLDMGVDYRHEDLRQNVWINADEVPNNGRDDDENGWVDDLYGFNFVRMKAEVLPAGIHHGTLTSSVVAGDGTGGKVTGVAPRARIMPLMAWGGPYVAALAYQYAIENGADVMSMSFSIPGLGAARGVWRLMSEHACASGLVLVSGAGNFQRQAKIPVQIRIPEGIPCVICAGGVNRKGKVPPFVSLGPVEWKSVPMYGDYPMPKGLVKPDVCAFPGPGIGLVSPAGTGYLPENNPKRGNSLSAPHVAGVCALMLSVNPELTPWRVKEILEKTAVDLAPAGKDPRTGAGLVHAYRAVKAAKK